MGLDMIQLFKGGLMDKGAKPREIPGVSSTDLITLDVTKYKPFIDEYHILAGLLMQTGGFRTYVAGQGPIMADVDELIEDMKPFLGIGLDVTPVRGPPLTPLNFATTIEADLDRFTKVVSLNFE